MQCSIFLLQVSQKSTSRVINGRTVRNGPEASGKRLFFQGTRPDDPWQNCKIREKLINEGKELTLDKAVDIAWTYEMSQSEMKSMEARDKAVHIVNRDQRSRKDPPRSPMEPPQRGTCGRCRKTHTNDSRPAMGKTCLKWFVMNLWYVVCFSVFLRILQI